MRTRLKKSSILKAQIYPLPLYRLKPEASKASSDIHIVSNYSIKASISGNSVILV